MPRDKVLDWLLEPDQPSIRYLALTRLLGKKETDSDVRAAKARIPTTGWVAHTLARRDPGGWWVRPMGWLEPRFLGTNWNLLALSDLGASREIPEVRASSEFWMGSAPLKGGGVGGFGKGKGHHCYTANMALALIRMGYEDDPRVRKTLEYLVRTAHPKGGWTCRFGTDGPATSRTLDAWEGLSAFAAYPKPKWTRSMTECVEKGAEYYLERELHTQGAEYDPWYRFHWPVHYYYDVLVGLDVLTALGFGDDNRLGFALDLLQTKRRPEGRWDLDAVQPDWSRANAAKVRKYFAAHPKQRPTPLVFETPGEPSKMITLRALAVLARVG